MFAAWTGMYILREHAAWTCSVDMPRRDIDIKRGHAAEVCRIKMQHGHEAYVCSIDMHGDEAWTCA